MPKSLEEIRAQALSMKDDLDRMTSSAQERLNKSYSASEDVSYSLLELSRDSYFGARLLLHRLLAEVQPVWFGCAAGDDEEAVEEVQTFFRHVDQARCKVDRLQQRLEENSDAFLPRIAKKKSKLAGRKDINNNQGQNKKAISNKSEEDEFIDLERCDDDEIDEIMLRPSSSSLSSDTENDFDFEESDMGENLGFFEEDVETLMFHNVEKGRMIAATAAKTKEEFDADVESGFGDEDVDIDLEALMPNTGKKRKTATSATRTKDDSDVESGFEDDDIIALEEFIPNTEMERKISPSKTGTKDKYDEDDSWFEDEDIELEIKMSRNENEKESADAKGDDIGFEDEDLEVMSEEEDELEGIYGGMLGSDCDDDFLI